MIKMNSISGIICYVKDLDRTKEFYEKLGFRASEQEGNSFRVYLNWFWIRFIVDDKEVDLEIQKEAQNDHKGAGAFTCISVTDIDEFYQSVLDKGFSPASKPRDMASGNRMFILRDPDGYKLVFFTKK